MTAPTHLDLTDSGTLNSLLQRHGFFTRKGLGQHFLISSKALNAILDACALEDSLPILEIGPGIGVVTRALAERGAQVTAVEIDARALQVLDETVGAFPRVAIIRDDILAIDLSALLADRRWTVVGNLPYYITTPVIARILELAPRVARAVFMVQREVGERLMAPPGSKIYGALSVFAQVYAEVERVARVPKGAFFPPPTVESMVIRLTMHPQPLVPSSQRETFFQVVRAAFGQRRKTLENALAGGGVLGGEREAVSAILRAVEIDPTRRGETLSIAEFLRIADELAR